MCVCVCVCFFNFPARWLFSFALITLKDLGYFSLSLFSSFQCISFSFCVTSVAICNSLSRWPLHNIYSMCSCPCHYLLKFWKVLEHPNRQYLKTPIVLWWNYNIFLCSEFCVSVNEISYELIRLVISSVEMCCSAHCLRRNNLMKCLPGFSNFYCFQCGTWAKQFSFLPVCRLYIGMQGIRELLLSIWAAIFPW